MGIRFPQVIWKIQLYVTIGECLARVESTIISATDTSRHNQRRYLGVSTCVNLNNFAIGRISDKLRVFDYDRNVSPRLVQVL